MFINNFNIMKWRTENSTSSIEDELKDQKPVHLMRPRMLTDIIQEVTVPVKSIPAFQKI